MNQMQLNAHGLLESIEERLAQVEPALRDALLRIPNLPLPEVPVGKDDSENIVTRVEGQPRVFDFAPRPHWEIGEALGMMERLAKPTVTYTVDVQNLSGVSGYEQERFTLDTALRIWDEALE